MENLKNTTKNGCIIECQNVTSQYGSFVACRNVSFSVNKGDYLCIVGANGSGKSTIVKTILGLIEPKNGKIIRQTAQIGYLPQKTEIQRDFPATVKEVVLSGTILAQKRSNFGIFYSREQKQQAQNQMEKLELLPIANKSFRELSGGQQQRVLLARSLCAAKDLLVLDEPVTGLDPAVTDELYTIIRKLNQEENLAVIMVSHDVHRAVQNASHILHMDKEVAFFGTTGEYQKNPLYNDLSHVEVCQTHLCTHCGSDCNASHIILGQHSH
ncbi:MAG: metal ABC transporter ATP-binding protein [Treponemataceae bacterium]|nr:metal ABC transporter ATP-binding protein [Treponemataceae bacterium]